MAFNSIIKVPMDKANLNKRNNKNKILRLWDTNKYN